MILALRQSLQMLRLRPFLLLALCVGGGVGIGSALGAAQSGFRTFSVAPIFLVFICIASALWLRFKPRAVFDIALISVALFLVFAFASQQRQFPPRSDISRLVRATAIPEGPQHRLPVTLNGSVAAAPRKSEFGVDFPFAVDENSKSTGNIWIRAPRDCAVRVGDALVLQVELADLPRAGNIGERAHQARLVAANCWAVARVETKELRVVRRAPDGFSTWLDEARVDVQNRYVAAFEGQKRPYSRATAQLLGAMVFGDRAGEPLPTSLRDAFRAAGLTHLLVASGTQVALLCALVLGAGRFFGLRGAWLLLGVVPVLVFYALFTGGAASIWRATVAGICVALAVSMGRPVDRVSLLALAFVALLCIDVAQIQDIGFQLSFAAAWGLAVLAPVLARHLKWLSGSALVAELLAATFAAQLATLPFTLYHFGRATPHAFLANAIVLPIAALLVGGGLIGLAWPAFNGVNYFLVSTLRAVAEDVSTWRGAAAHSPPMNLLFAFIIGAILLMTTSNFAWLRDWRAIVRDETTNLKPALRRNSSAFAVLLLMLCGFSAWRFFQMRDDRVRVVLLDVGQGESIVITHRDRAVVLDCGTTSDEGRGDVGASVLVPYLQSRGVRRVDAIIISHADADHVNGFKALLGEVPVGLAIDGAAHWPAWSLQDSPDYLELRAALKRRNIKTIAAQAGQTLDLDGAILRFLAPLSPPLKNFNDNAAVVMLEHGNVRMLLTADIEAAGESRIARRQDVRCDILKLAHHGSKTSSTEPLLRAANPRFALLSCGRYNSFGHPNPDVLARFAKRDIPVFRTDRDGAITVLSDGKTAQIETFR